MALNISETGSEPLKENQQRLDFLGILFLLLSILFSVSAQFVLKKAMLHVGSFDLGGAPIGFILDLINIWVILGLLLYGTGTIFWIMCLKKIDLGLAYPMGTFQYIFIFIGAYFLFDESISWVRLVGMALICLGVIVISKDFWSK